MCNLSLLYLFILDILDFYFKSLCGQRGSSSSVRYNDVHLVCLFGNISIGGVGVFDLYGVHCYSGPFQDVHIHYISLQFGMLIISTCLAVDS